MVHIKFIDKDPWIAEIYSDLNDNKEESILVGVNGKLALWMDGWLVELWPGFASEKDFDMEEYIEDVDEEDS